MYLHNFKPTFLYIKQHSVTGKLYFGKTCKENVESYVGSGKYWQRHIKKYGRDKIVTLWYCLFYSKEECMQFALNFSKQEDIVNSTNWANLVYENGQDGGTLGPKSEEHKANMCLGKISQKQKGIQVGGIYSAEHKNAFLEGCRKYWTGRTFSDERKKEISIRNMGSGNSNAKKWEIEDDGGNKFTLHSCKQWCKDQGIAQRTFINRSISGKFTNGFRIVS